MRSYLYIPTIAPLLIVMASCSQPVNNSQVPLSPGTGRSQAIRIDSAALISVARFSPPEGYQRLHYNENTFQYYLSHFPLKPLGAKIYYYNGELKPNQLVGASVLDIDIGTKNLQQCADAVIRLRAEYLFENKRFDEIHFNLTNGFRVDYSKWREGYRIKLSGNNTTWYKASGNDYSTKCFKEYLELIFSYAGTLSLSKELFKIPPDSLQVGDVFVHGGSPGHAVIIVDLAINAMNNKKIFMIAQSYMPAQNIHLLINDNNKDLSPWYDLSGADKLYSPEWTFEKSDLKRFQ